MKITIAVLTGLMALAGCSVPKQGGFGDVRTQVAARTGHTVFWNQGGEADNEVRKVVRTILAHELAPAEAVQVALLNNPTLQGTYEELAVAQADLVQAGLLKNPVFTGFFHVPIAAGSVPHWEIGVEQDFLDILMIPAKRRIAAAAFEAAKLRVGGEVIHFAYEVRASYFLLLCATQVVVLHRTLFDAAQASIEIAKKQHDAGNMSDLDLASEEAVYNAARLDLARSQAELVDARERLTRLMGLWGEDTQFRVPASLPDLPVADPSLNHLESLAMSQRLDVASARQELQARLFEVAMVKDWRWIGGLSAGAGIDRDSDGPRSIGPAGSVELPLFDQRQATIAKLEAEARRSDKKLVALAINARSEVREASAHLNFARGLVEYQRSVVIPNRERIVQLSQVHYNAMLLGVYQLLQAKQNEVNAYRDYIQAVRDYWVARADLGQAVGGRITTTSSLEGAP